MTRATLPPAASGLRWAGRGSCTLRAGRALARARFEPGRFIDVSVDTALAVAEARDPKGLYRRARLGQPPRFTGIGAPSEPPRQPDGHIDTALTSAERAAGQVVAARSHRALSARIG
jgi:adenylylsulfate kinase-like enzyme